MKAYGVSRLRSAAVLLAGAMAIGTGASPAAAQVPDAAVLNIMRECAKIDDPTARLACYDNNVRSGGFDGRGPAVPGEAGRVAGSGAPNQTSGPGGFGAEGIKSPERFQSYEQRGIGLDSISARVESVRERQPGMFLVTLESGAQWLFTNSAPNSYRPPREGDTVEISRASLGSFLLRFNNQGSIRVRRVK
jgi:hypothetical protein